MSDRKTAHAEVEIAEPTDAAPQKKTGKKNARRPQRQPRYNVILWDDNDHSYDYVVRMLRELFGHPFEKGYQMAVEVDTVGRTICLTTTLEHAELKRDQIHAYGRDNRIPKCAGSMSASIEPVE